MFESEKGGVFQFQKVLTTQFCPSAFIFMSTEQKPIGGIQNLEINRQQWIASKARKFMNQTAIIPCSRTPCAKLSAFFARLFIILSRAPALPAIRRPVNCQNKIHFEVERDRDARDGETDIGSRQEAHLQEREYDIRRQIPIHIPLMTPQLLLSRLEFQLQFLGSSSSYSTNSHKFTSVPEPLFLQQFCSECSPSPWSEIKQEMACSGCTPGMHLKALIWSQILYFALHDSAMAH